MSEYNGVSNRASSRDSRYKNRYNKRQALKQKHRENKTLLISVVVVIVLISVILSVSFFGGTKNNALVGVWKYDRYTEYEFSEDGNGCLCVDDVHYEYKYDITGERLEIDFTGEVVRDCEYIFEIKGDTLILTGGEGTDGGTYELKKIQ